MWYLFFDWNAETLKRFSLLILTLPLQGHQLLPEMVDIFVHISWYGWQLFYWIRWQPSWKVSKFDFVEPFAHSLKFEPFRRSNIGSSSMSCSARVHHLFSFGYVGWNFSWHNGSKFRLVVRLSQKTPLYFCEEKWNDNAYDNVNQLEDVRNLSLWHLGICGIMGDS